MLPLAAFSGHAGRKSKSFIVGFIAAGCLRLPVIWESPGQGALSSESPTILLAVPNQTDATTPQPRDRHPGSERLREYLVKEVEALNRSQRSLERELGWGHGSLRLVLRGKVEITLRHVEELARALGTTPLELLGKAYGEAAMPEEAADLPPGWVDVLTYQMMALEQAGEVFQQLQELIPRPTLEEVAEMRKGTKPVTRHAYLIGQLQAFMCDLENVASDLKVDLEYQFDPEGAEKLVDFFNGLETAIQRLTPPRGPVA